MDRSKDAAAANSNANAERAARLAEQLRANLRKRKAQARGLADGPQVADTDDPAS